MTVEYDPQHGILYSALRLRSTVVSQVICRGEFYLLLGFHCIVSAAYKMGYFEPEMCNMDLTMRMTGVTGSLMTFFVVFYNGNVFQRYNRLYELTKQMNEMCLYTTAILAREISCKHTVRKLSRMLLASSLLFFFERSKPVDEHHVDHNISRKEWNHLEAMGLVDGYERGLLEAHCRALGASAIPSFLLLQWSMRLYRTKSEKNARIAEVEKAYWRVRHCQEEVVEILDLPMPFQYFHIMNLMLLLNLALWAYAFALMDSYLASVIFLAIQLVFQGIRELSIALSDPYGSDDADFPLNTWVNQLYIRIVGTVEDSWEVSTFAPKGKLGPLPFPKPGEWILDLLVDESSTGRQVATMAFQSPDAAQGDWDEQFHSHPHSEIQGRAEHHGPARHLPLGVSGTMSCHTVPSHASTPCSRAGRRHHHRHNRHDSGHHDEHDDEIHEDEDEDDDD